MSNKKGNLGHEISFEMKMEGKYTVHSTQVDMLGFFVRHEIVVSF